MRLPPSLDQFSSTCSARLWTFSDQTCTIHKTVSKHHNVVPSPSISTKLGDAWSRFPQFPAAKQPRGRWTLGGRRRGLVASRWRNPSADSLIAARVQPAVVSVVAGQKQWRRPRRVVAAATYEQHAEHGSAGQHGAQLAFAPADRHTEHRRPYTPGERRDRRFVSRFSSEA